MEKIILLVVIFSLFLGGVAFAIEADLPDPGLTPDSPIYFFDTWGEKIGLFFTFSAEKKAEKTIKYAEEKLAEAKIMVEEEKTETLEKANQRYEELLDLASRKIKEARKEGKQVKELQKKMEQLTVDCNEFPEKLRSCIPYKCQFTHPLTGQKMQRRIKGIVEGECRYIEEMPGDGKMECSYTKSEREVAAQYYERIMAAGRVGVEVQISDEGIKTTSTINGKKIKNPLQEFLNEGICKISGYEEESEEKKSEKKEGVLEWISPTGSKDSSDMWTNETLAYDDNLETYASYTGDASLPHEGALVLTHSGVIGSKIRLFIESPYYISSLFLGIEVRHHGFWESLSDKVIHSDKYNKWVEVSFGETYEVTGIRIHLEGGGGFSSGDICHVKEVDFGKDLKDSADSFSKLSNQEKDSKIVSAIGQSRTVMMYVYEEDGNYDNFTTTTPEEMSDLSNKITGNNPDGAVYNIEHRSKVNSTTTAIYSGLNRGDGFYCADSGGHAGYTNINPNNDRGVGVCPPDLASELENK